MIEISVVIPSFNQPDKIEHCIKSILAQNFTKTYEIIIVDSSAPIHQAKVEAICLMDTSIKLIKLDKQTYPGVARNIGIKASLGNIIALIDSDCVAQENWLNHIYNNISDDVILTGVVQNGTKTSVLGTCAFLVEFNHFLDFKEEKREVLSAATCNFACKKTVFERVGYFTNDRAFEDFLFCYKFRKQGGSIYQIRAIAVEHLNKTAGAAIVANQKMLGYYSAKVRKTNAMPPQVVFKYPLLAFGLIGFRYFSIISRVVKTEFFIQFLLYTPILIYFIIQWGIGFYKGAKEHKD